MHENTLYFFFIDIFYYCYTFYNSSKITKIHYWNFSYENFCCLGYTKVYIVYILFIYFYIFFI